MVINPAYSQNWDRWLLSTLCGENASGWRPSSRPVCACYPWAVVTDLHLPASAFPD